MADLFPPDELRRQPSPLEVLQARIDELECILYWIEDETHEGRIGIQQPNGEWEIWDTQDDDIPSLEAWVKAVRR